MMNEVMDWTVIAAVNDETVLKTCLLNSPGIQSASNVLLQRGYASAAAAYNAGISDANTDLLVFAHQDMYFPEGWSERVLRAVRLISKDDPFWGVLGTWGVHHSAGGSGHVYCTAGRRMFGGPFEGGKEINALDEVVLILRKSSGLRFDEQLPGFHMYGTDICLEAARQGRKCYAVSAFCIHNSNAYKLLPFAFWRSYLYLRKKWKTQLPACTPCTVVTYWCWPMIRYNIVQSANVILRRHKVYHRFDNPAQLYEQMFSRRKGATSAESVTERSHSIHE